MKDLSDLYNYDLGDNYIGVADDWGTGWYDGRKERYFNNGIMLLNLKKMREDDIENKLINCKEQDKVKRFVTQDVFNEVMQNKAVFIPLIYDTFSPEYDNDGVIEKIKSVLGKNFDLNTYPCTTDECYRDSVVVIHYCGWNNFKPWDDVDFKRESSRIWYKYVPEDFWESYYNKIYNR